MENLEDKLNTVVGTAGDDDLDGSPGDDLIISGGGSDSIDGDDGVDTVVFEGVAADYTIETTGGGSSSVTDGEDTVTMQDIEFFEFDDQTISILEFEDDFGDTRPQAGFIKLFPLEGKIAKKIPVAKAPLKEPLEEIDFGRVAGNKKGIINATGDIDGFTVFLEADETYIIQAGAFSSALGHMEITSVFDPNDVLVDGSDDGGTDTITVTAETEGSYFFTVGATKDGLGPYDVRVDEVRLTGNSGDNNLLGTNDADVLEGGAGDDFIDGNGGIDVAVFDGNRADFIITPGGGGGIPILGPEGDFAPILLGGSDGPRVTVERDDLIGETDELVNVEILRFDDGDVSVLEFIDDFGDDLASAGEIQMELEKPGGKFGSTGQAKGEINAIGDVDAFSVELAAGETFSLFLEESFFFDFASAEGDEASDFPFTLQSVLDPQGNAVELRADDRFGGQGGDGGDVRSFQSAIGGTYLISVAGLGENVGGYSLDLLQLNATGTEDGNFLFGSPFDDTLETGGDDDLVFFSAGSDIIDGGEGLQDEIFANGVIEDFVFSVADDDTITLTGPDGSQSTITNVEIFSFEDNPGGLETEVLASDLLAFAASAGGSAAFNVNVGDNDDDALTGDLDNDIYQGGGGNDVITDPGGNSDVDAGAGADRVGLVSGDNTVDGGSEDDLIVGGYGNDNLSGGSGNDVIIGDVSLTLSGSDRIEGGTGDDLLEGRGGQDTFVFATADGTDTIGALNVDFDVLANSTATGPDFVSGLDMIELAGFGYADQDAAFANVTDVAGTATFSDQGTTIVFTGLTVSDLSSDDFILV